MNFNEILFQPQYGFQRLIQQENDDLTERTDGIRYELVENLYASPSVRRQIWMALKVIDEVQSFMGGAPKRVFVEMAREKQESKRTSDRNRRFYSYMRIQK